MRDWFEVNTGILFPDYARPDGWWQNGMDLFSDIYKAEGFRAVDIAIQDIKIADVMLMAYGSSFPNHSALYVGEGKILQHFHGKLSSKESIRSHHRDALLAIVRHPDIIVKTPPKPKLDLLDMLSPHWKQQLREKYGGADDDTIRAEIKKLGEEQRDQQERKRTQALASKTS